MCSWWKTVTVVLDMQTGACLRWQPSHSLKHIICRQLVSIRRPELLEPALFPASAAGGLPISAGTPPNNRTRRRSWASSDYLADRLNYFSKYMKVIHLTQLQQKPNVC